MYKFGIIGCGRIAPRHAEQIKKYGQLIAACDIIKERADVFAEKYSAKAYYKIDDLLAAEKLLDIVCVCTPNGYHAEHCIKSAQAGKHVLCEKPLCITSAAAWQMIETARLCRKNLFVVKSTRFNPSLQSLKKIIEEGTFGHLYSFQLNCFWNRPAQYYSDSWRGSLFPDGGTLYTQFSHYIDALIWLLGDVKIVSGYRKNLAHKGIIEFEDSGIAAIEMNNGMLGGLNWSVNTFQKNMEVSLTILGEQGSIRIGGEYMNRIEYQCTNGPDIKSSSFPEQANDYGFYKGSMSNHDKVYENLVKALKDENHPFVNALDGLKTVELIEKIYNSVSLS